ncbi:MAG TPA: PolC-type DNA polymerase III, partial [Acholeplasmataceae bacterium]|nr:PolC-type DNA polymerase III [Acholeplasmataceae bacterium]
MPKSRFINFLSLLNLEVTSELEKGTLEQINIKKEPFSWTVVFGFPKVLDIDIASVLINRTQDYFAKAFSQSNLEVRCNVKFNYLDKNIDDNVLEKYFKIITRKYAQEKPRYNALTNFNYKCDKNRIVIYVASNNEVRLINELIEGLEPIFKGFSLDVIIDIEVSPFETPLEKLIEKNQKQTTEEILKEQQTFENLQNNNTDKKEPKKRAIKRMPRLKQGINRPITPLKDLPSSEVELIEYQQRNGNNEFTIQGEIISKSVEEKQRRDDPSNKFKIFEAIVSDGQDSIMIKSFINSDVTETFYEETVSVGNIVKVYGILTYDKFARDVVLQISEVHVMGEADKKDEIIDDAPVRRVELHAHTKLSVLDGVMEVEDYVRQAVKFKHRALAVTDMYNVQALPELENATRNLDILPIYGLEGALIDEDKFKIALSDADIDLKDATYIIYDLETTGFSSIYHEIIEIAAVKVKNGMIIDEFSSYVKPKNKITEFITKLTSITNDDVRAADPIEIVLPKFKKFIGDGILVAHNASFDNSHLYENMKRLNIYDGIIPTIDTMQLARVRYGHKLKKFNLKAVAKYFDVDLTQHHRAIYDARATGLIFINMLNDLIDDGILNYQDINNTIDREEIYKLSYPSHFTILSKNEIGKKNLYILVSDSHTNHFHREPRILKSVLDKHREGLLIGSGCMNGEVFETAFEKNDDELRKVMEYYDYIEVQPLSLYGVIVEKNQDPKTWDYIKDTIKRIIKVAKELGKIVVATGDVHHLTKEDVILRQILIDTPQIGGGTHPLLDVENLPSFHFMTTNEMLKEFSFLDDDLAYEIVVTNTNKIADMIERYNLFPDKLFAPSDDLMKDRGIPSFRDGVISITTANAKALYGDPLPKYIEDRIKKELSSIIGNNFASVYYISYLLVQHSQDAGYVVGSRGSVGSSLVANLMKITEVNPLPPHYYCSHCHFVAIKMREEEKRIYERDEKQIALDSVLQSVGTGYDLPKMNCPNCGRELLQDGVDIPFETFLGFKGEKVPDIDLNFSGEYQIKAHDFCREIFGEDHVFRAGTISTTKEKTAYGYIRKYFEKRNKQVREAEIKRLANKIVGVKRSTGQHPGGIVVIPREIEYYAITPIQYPADDLKASWKTTHYDYHKFESNLLKLDILGHDDPTMIRHLMNFVEAYPEEFPFSKVEEIPLNDSKVMEIFNGLNSLNITPDKVCGETIGTTGIPEFGTALTKEMLSEIRPTTVDELLKVSGLSHGTDVWKGNARDLLLGLKEGFPKIPFRELIGCRDDIMVYLISKGLPANDAFKIMESVRKGKGVSKDYEKEMLSYNVPKWYIESCKLIKYMFPKAHATAYVIMALRIGWFKVHRPIYYYAAYFSRRATQFDVVAMARGYEAIRSRYLELDEKIKNNKASAKEIETHYTLLLALEMTARGYSFKQINILHSHAKHFLVSKDRKSLLIPFSALESLGEATAYSIVNARKEKPFTSKQDIMRRTKLTVTLFEKMDALGCFGNLPED